MIEVKVAVLDDEMNDLNRVKDYFDHVSSCQLKYSVTTYQDIDESFYHEYDLYMIDIEMPKINGLDVARDLRKKHPHGVLILYSKRNDLVFESFKFGVFSFVRKDHFEEDMSFAQMRLDQHFQSVSQKYQYRTKDLTLDIPYRNIMYIEKIGHHIEIHLNDKKILSEYKSLKNIIHEFDHNQFIQCHQSYLVNLSYVKYLDKQDFIMKDNEKVQISKRFYQKTKQSYINYLNKKVSE